MCTLDHPFAHAGAERSATVGIPLGTNGPTGCQNRRSPKGAGGLTTGVSEDTKRPKAYPNNPKAIHFGLATPNESTTNNNHHNGGQNVRQH